MVAPVKESLDMLLEIICCHRSPFLKKNPLRIQFFHILDLRRTFLSGEEFPRPLKNCTSTRYLITLIRLIRGCDKGSCREPHLFSTYFLRTKVMLAGKTPSYYVKL
jgi:hypothetical protein